MSPGREYAQHFAQLREGILGVQVLHELVGVGEVNAAVGQWQRAPVGEVNVKICLICPRGGDGTGNVYGMDFGDDVGKRARQRQVAGADLEHSRLRLQERLQEVQLARHPLPPLGRSAALQLRMVGKLAKQLLVHLGVERAARGGGGVAQTLSERTLKRIVLAQLRRAAPIATPASRSAFQAAISGHSLTASDRVVGPGVSVNLGVSVSGGVGSAHGAMI
jgi:hypothetical protein